MGTVLLAGIQAGLSRVIWLPHEVAMKVTWWHSANRWLHCRILPWDCHTHWLHGLATPRSPCFSHIACYDSAIGLS